MHDKNNDDVSLMPFPLPKHMVQISVMLLLPRNWRQSSEEIPGECEGVPAAMCQKRDSWLDMMWPRVLALQGEKQQVVIEATISREFWNQYRVAWFENRRVLWTCWLYQTLCRVGQSTFHKLIFVGPQSTSGMTSDMLKNAHKIVRKLIGMYQVYGLVFNSTGFSEDKFLVCMCSLFPSCLLNVWEETSFSCRCAPWYS